MIVDDELLDRFLAGEVSEEEATSVAQWMAEPANLERFAERAQLHADIRSSLRRRSIQSTALESHAPKSLSKNHTPGRRQESFGARASPTTLSRFVVAAVAAVVLLIAFSLPREEIQTVTPEDYLASIVAEVDAVLVRDQASWQQDGLAQGRYRLQQGLLHLRFDGGVMVYVEAPAEFDAVSGKRLVLHRGRLSANVPPEGIGFAVETPEAEVVDFGTEFSVDVESGTSEVHVFNGLVRVQPRSKEGIESGDAVDLRTAQAIKIKDTADGPIGIAIARDRFIRNFEEPKRRYSRSLKQLNPVAIYRMLIRDKGLVSAPPRYSGVVLTGDGRRPPHARGVFAGGSLRVRADSTGRGGRVDSPPSLNTGQLTLVAFVFLDSENGKGVVVTNIEKEQGSFSLHLDPGGKLQATIRVKSGELKSLSSTAILQIATWTQVVVTVDGEQLLLYENGQPAASTKCSPISNSDHETVWFGTDAEATSLWDGRIDEVTFFDTALSAPEIETLFQAALEEMARLE